MNCHSDHNENAKVYIVFDNLGKLCVNNYYPKSIDSPKFDSGKFQKGQGLKPLTLLKLFLAKINWLKMIFFSQLKLSQHLTSDQRCFNVVDQRWNNVDATLKMKQNSTSDFQRCLTFIQRRCPTLKQRWNNFDTTLSRHCFDVGSTLVKTISKPVGLVISTDL